MSRFLRFAAGVCFAALAPMPLFAQGRPVALATSRVDAASLRAADLQVTQMLRSGELRLRESVRDPLMPDRTHERLDQYVRGVRIVGGDLTRQTAADGTVSIFGMLHDAVDIPTTPTLDADAAQRAIAAAGGGAYRSGSAELVILPLSDGYHLAYLGQATTDVDIVNVAIDATSGALLKKYSEFITEVAVGTGTYGDAKKLSVKPQAGTFVADDGLRPSEITTYDLKGNFGRTLAILDGLATSPTDIASNSSTQWTDGTVVDGHAYAGWYYDFLFKRFNRRGLDDRDLRIPVLTHPVPANAIASATPDVVGLFYLNAFWCPSCMADGKGSITFGEGARNGSYFRGLDVKPFSAALDVVAHELTHGVTAYTARLNGYPFSDAGALNEAFSDMFGTATEFFYQPVGTGPLKADYLIGEDLVAPFGAATYLVRSLSNPLAYGYADHYSQRNPAGEVHQQSTIASHAFYLAIEGGTNRTSGLSVTGVSAANRDQIEKAFFRALTVLLPSNATYALTRDTTIQAARDLYGSGSAAERAITQAWDAVGVQDRIAPTATLLPNPAVSTADVCGGFTPSWALGVTVSAGNRNLQITQWVYDVFDSSGANIEHAVHSPATFASFFTSCGPASANILAQTDACAVICSEIRGKTSGTEVNTFTAIDSSGQTITFATPRVALQQ
ncbi:MAG TPA: M4 family metallopeptidase [Vicinamibacterales bacterium]|nr:M4 family metallopeptidase [Vicinamibacterales bacterium]